MNLGRIDMDRVRQLARSAGISEAELNKALEERHITALSFSGKS